jgi:predicted RNase H-like nuclease (RuvC/YqgF family)
MHSKQKAAKKQPLTVKQLQAKNRQLKKDLAEEDRVNHSAVKTIGELRQNIEEQNQVIRVQQENIDLLKRQLELQAAIFSRAFSDMNELEFQMQTTLKGAEIKPS